MLIVPESWLSDAGWPPPTAAWHTSFEISLPEDYDQWTGWTVVCLIPKAYLALTGGTQCRVTFKAGSSEGLGIGNAYIQERATSGDPYDFSTTPVQLYWSSSASTTISAGQTAVTDTATFSIDGTDDILISAYFNGGSTADTMSRVQVYSIPTNYYISGSDAATVNKSGYADSPMDFVLISKVEIYAALYATGWKLPTSDTAVDGTWTNPTYVQAIDGNYATVTPAQSDTDTRQCGNFGFSPAIIPDSAVIDRVICRVGWFASEFYSINIRVAAKVGSTTYATHDTTYGTGQSPTTLVVDYFNLTPDKTWTAADFRDGTFDIKFTAIADTGAGGCIFSFDYVQVQVQFH